ncbi:MAG: hypothetical protein A6F72_03065 [Cycloclasticus sp. symbiont of Poecilosclerida sp. N]|nr:MAG: hypothetical protein A6F72_03065 [Cycloclasticus sp. symbiont of Poecilosclerida sp. N]
MKNLLKIIIVAGFVTASFNSLAADWTITQSADITTTNLTQLSLDQGVTTAVSNSRQAINGVVLNGAEDDLVSGSQTAPILARALDMNQDGQTTVGSSQAINHIAARNIGATGATGLVRQTGVMTGVLLMTQKAGAGNNVQGGNVMVTSSTGNIVNAAQELTITNEINLGQEIGSNTNNVQALNLADTTANSSGTVDTLVQSFDHTGANGLTLSSRNAASGNVQAGNMVDSLGSITDLRQTFSFLNSSLGFFNLVGTGSSNIQAGNMARTDGTGSVIVEISQTFTGSSRDNVFTMSPFAGPTVSELVQAGNLIDIGQGAITDLTDHQVFSTEGTMTMTQTGGVVDSLQALNAITDKTGGSAATQARQSLTASGAFSMDQRVATTSGQFGNFAGLRR